MMASTRLCRTSLNLDSMALQLYSIYTALLEDEAAVKRIKSSGKKALWYRIQKVVVHAVWLQEELHKCSHVEAIAKLDNQRGNMTVDSYMREVDKAIKKSMMKPNAV